MDPEETIDVSTGISLSESSSNEQNELPLLKDPCDLVELSSHLSLDSFEELKTLAEGEGESLTATWTLLDGNTESSNELGAEIPQTEQLKSNNADVNLEDRNDLSDSKLSLQMNISSVEDPGSNEDIVNREDLEQNPSVTQESSYEGEVYNLSIDEATIVDAFIVSPILSEEKVYASSNEETEAHITKRKSETSDSDVCTETPQLTLKKCKVEEDVNGQLSEDSQLLRMKESVEEFHAAYLVAKDGVQPDQYKFPVTTIEQESKMSPKNEQEKLESMQGNSDEFVERGIKETSLREPTLGDVGVQTDKDSRTLLPTSSSLEEGIDSVQGKDLPELLTSKLNSPDILNDNSEAHLKCDNDQTAPIFVDRADASTFPTSEDYISGNKCMTLLAWEKPNNLFDLVCIDRDKLRNEGFDLPRLPIVGRINDAKARDIIKYVKKENLIEKLNADIKARNSNEQVDVKQNDSSCSRTPDERIAAAAEVLASMRSKNNLSKDYISNTEERENEIDQTHLSTESLQASAMDDSPPLLKKSQSTISKKKSEFGGVFDTLKKLLVFGCFTVIIVFVIIISRLTGMNFIVPRKEMRDSRKPSKSQAKEFVSLLQKGANEL